MESSKQMKNLSLVALIGCSFAVTALAACGSKDPQTATNPTNQAAYGQPQQYGQTQQQYPQQQVPGQTQPYPQQQAQYPQQQQPYPQQPYPQQQVPAQPYPQQQVPTTTAPAPTGAAPAPTGTAATGMPTNPLDPAFLQQAAAAAAAVLQQPGAATSLADPTEAGLKLAATRFAPGMQPEGQEAKQTMTEGQHVSMGVAMQGGKCYTIIGFSPLGGVKDLDLTLLAPPFYNMSAGSDGTKDANPIIGKGTQPYCPIIPMAVQYKLDIFAKAGAGPVAVQVYSKTK